MRTRVDARLLDEAARFTFRFACDDCAHFDERRQRCSLGYPAEPRVDAFGPVEGLEFCKEFELG